MALIRSLLRAVVGLALLVLLSAAALASLGRYFFPYASEYRSEILTLVNSAAPFQIDAQALEGDWQRLAPSLKVQGLALGVGQDPLHIHEASAQFNIAQSIWLRTLVFDRLSLAGVVVDLSEDAEGRWSLKGDWLPEPKGPSRWFDLDGFYRGLDELHLDDATLIIRRNNGRRIEVDHLKLSFLKKGDRWRLKSSGLPDKSALPIELLLEGIGHPARDQFKLQAYTALSGFDASPYLLSVNYQGWTPALPRFDGELWLDYDKQGASALQGSVDLHNIEFTHSAGKQGIDIPKLKTSFKVRLDQGNTPSIWLRNLKMTLKEEEVAFEHANLLPADDSLAASFDSITIKPVLRLLRRFEVLPEKAQEVLATLDPGGVIRDITLTVPNDGGMKAMSLTATAENLSVKPWKNSPGANNVSGFVSTGIKGGHIELDTENLSLWFPKVFDKPLSFAQARGAIQWRVGEQQVSVRSGLLELNDEMGAAHAFLDLGLPLKKEYGIDPTMDLHVALRNSKAEYRDRLVPFTLDKGLRDWLARAVLDADIPEAAFIYRGSLAKGSGLQKTIQLALQLERAEVDYESRWPAARAVDALAFVDDTRVLVEASSAKVSGLGLSEAIVRFEPVKGKKGGMIEVDTAINGQVSDALGFLQDSPIKKQLGNSLDEWQGQGRISGKVLAEIPIGLKVDPNVRLRSRLKGASFKNAGLRLEFENLNGPLRYTTKKGLYSPGLVATLWSDPLKAEISSKQLPNKRRGGDPTWSTEIEVAGSTHPEAVLDWLNYPLHDLLSGEFEYQAKLMIRAEDSRLDINSRLVQLESELPAPFKKSSGEDLPFKLNLYLNEKPVRMRIKARDTVRAALTLHQDAPVSGTISFGEDAKPSFIADTVRLEGELAEFDLTEYLGVISAFANSSASAAGDSQRSMPEVFATNLMLRKFNAFGAEFSDVNTAVASHRGSWTFAFESIRAAGRAIYDSSQELALDLSLNHLYLPTPPEAAAGEKNDLLADTYPSDLPAMRFRLGDLKIGDSDFGRWAFESSEIEHGIIFRNVEAESRGLRISGRDTQNAFVRWRRVGDQQTTEFNGVLSCGDLGSVLEAWGYAAAIRSKSCWFDTELSWYGSPLQLELAQMEGRVDILLNNGQFLETNSTANATRLLSLFNFDTILRRLQFRFDDVFNRGLSYDEITGQFALANGTLNIEQPFKVNGPSSKLQMTGSLSLVDETIDGNMVATLPISSNLPWVAALAGGLPIAAGVYVAGKIFQKPMDKLSSASYEIKGGWDNPSIELQKIFDDDTPKTQNALPVKPVIDNDGAAENDASAATPGAE